MFYHPEDRVRETFRLITVCYHLLLVLVYAFYVDGTARRPIAKRVCTNTLIVYIIIGILTVAIINDAINVHI